MSKIQISNLTFQYPGQIYPLFEDVNLVLDTDWKLGLIGRNGKGKTTLFKLLLEEYEYQGTISKRVEFEYFPFEIKEKEKMTLEILEEIDPHLEGWKIMKELNLLKANTEILYRPFHTLSGGEQVKVLLSFLFAKENHFLLMDEPTNHLDYEARKTIAEYLSKKKGFILVSHDRELLDKVTNHILAINKHKIEMIQGNYSIWKENRDRQNHFEMKQNEKLQGEIKKLDNASKEKTGWSNQVEKTKYGTYNSGLRPDTGYIGHKYRTFFSCSGRYSQITFPSSSV